MSGPIDESWPCELKVSASFFLLLELRMPGFRFSRIANILKIHMARRAQPAAMLVQIGVTIGDAVEVDPAAFRVLKPKYKLGDLLAQCDRNIHPPVDMVAWETVPPVGKEVV